MLIFFFKSIQFFIIGIFVVFISDFRNKSGMVPIINEKITSLLKISYLVPLGIFVDILIFMDNLTYFTFLGLFLTVLGTAITVKAKYDLRTHHTWIGYCKDSSILITTGIYSYVRHPLYTGICLFMIGGLIAAIPNTTLLVSILFTIIIIYIMSFLAILASKETKHLQKTAGQDFLRYQKEVHPVFPIKKYSR